MFEICVFWSLLFFYFYNCFGTKRARNFVSFSHSILSVLNTYSNYDYNHIFNISFSYFTFDLFFIVFNLSFSELVYIYHHIVLLYVLTELKETENDLLVYTLHIGEISNFFTYIVYDCLKRNLNCIHLQLLQFVWFLYFRLFLSTKLLIYNFYDISQLNSFYLLLSLYVLGFVWTSGQFKRLCTRYHLTYFV